MANHGQARTDTAGHHERQAEPSSAYQTEGVVCVQAPPQPCDPSDYAHHDRAESADRPADRATRLLLD